MLSRLRLMLTGLFLSLALIACGDDAANTNEAADTAAPEVEATTAEETAPANEDGMAVEEGTSESALLEKYGEPDLKQETGVDDYQVVFYEWNTDEGVVSVQVHNGEVAFSQLTAK